MNPKGTIIQVTDTNSEGYVDLKAEELGDYKYCFKKLSSSKIYFSPSRQSEDLDILSKYIEMDDKLVKKEFLDNVFKVNEINNDYSIHKYTILSFKK